MEAVTQIPQGISWVSWITGSIVVAAFLLRQFLPYLKRKRVTDANDDAQINILDVLQHQLNNALMRVDLAERQRDEAVNALTTLKIEFGNLKAQLQHLEGELTRAQAIMNGAKP